MTAYAIGYYDQENVARKAAKRVERDIGRDEHVYLLNQHNMKLERKTLSSPNELASWLEERGFSPDEARFYATGLAQGGNLVVSVVDDKHLRPVLKELEKLEPEDLPRRKQVFREGRTEGHHAGTSHAKEEVRIPVVDETLHVGKRTEEGGVRVKREVHEEPVRHEVALREEHVKIERRPADRAARPGDHAFEDKTIEMRERHEEVVAKKVPRVKEDVVLTKEHGLRTEVIEDTLRKTDVTIERIGDVGFGEHHARAYGKREPYERYRPAYEWGYRLGASAEMRGYDFASAREDLRRTWESDGRRGRFDDVAEAVEYGFEAGRQQKA